MGTSNDTTYFADKGEPRLADSDLMVAKSISHLEVDFGSIFQVTDAALADAIEWEHFAQAINAQNKARSHSLAIIEDDGAGELDYKWM